MNYPLKNQLFAEILGTFCLVFVGTGAITVNELYGGALTHVGVAVSFGLIVLAMIYTVGDVSGAHLNPAVTLGFVAAKRMSFAPALGFIGAQLIGALAASLLVFLLFAESSSAERLSSTLTLGATSPSGSLTQAFVMEVVLSFILMFVILSVSTGAKEKGITAGLAIGMTVLLLALFGGPVTGASMNPARSLAPALVSGELGALWLYMLAPITGALIAVASCRLTRVGCEQEVCCEK